jgi:hypothetical protein
MSKKKKKSAKSPFQLLKAKGLTLTPKGLLIPYNAEVIAIITYKGKTTPFSNLPIKPHTSLKSSGS